LLSSNQVKHINSLKQKKFREIYRQFLAEGSKLVKEILESQYKVLNVYAIADWLKQNEDILLSNQVSFVEVSLGEMERITALSSPSPALAVAEIPEMTGPPTLINDLVLALDDIRDPGNLGTIIRIADWFGIKTIICSESSVDLYNPKVMQATMGSAFRINIFYTDLKKFLSSLSPEVKIYGTFAQGDSIYSTPLEKQGIIIIGNESSGISNEISLKVTDRISIPAYIKDSRHTDHAESLNASIATAIICSEFRRRMG